MSDEYSDPTFALAVKGLKNSEPGEAIDTLGTMIENNRKKNHKTNMSLEVRVSVLEEQNKEQASLIKHIGMLLKAIGALITLSGVVIAYLALVQ